MRISAYAGELFCRAALIMAALLWLDVNVCDGRVLSSIYFGVNSILYKRPEMLCKRICEKPQRIVEGNAGSNRVVLDGGTYALDSFDGRQEELVECLQYCARIGDRMPICYFVDLYCRAANADAKAHAFSVWLKSLISASASDDEHHHWWVYETSWCQEEAIALERFVPSTLSFSLVKWNLLDRAFACLFHLIKGLGMCLLAPVILYFLMCPSVVNVVMRKFGIVSRCGAESVNSMFGIIKMARVIIPLVVLCALVIIQLLVNPSVHRNMLESCCRQEVHL